MIEEARQVRHIGSNTNVDGAGVVHYWWTPWNHDHFLVLINAGNDPRDQPGLRKSGKFHQIDVQLIPRIVACNKSGQHTRICSSRRRINQCNPHPRQRVHPPRTQHQCMCMAAANQHEVSGLRKHVHSDVIAATSLGRKPLTFPVTGSCVGRPPMVFAQVGQIDEFCPNPKHAEPIPYRWFGITKGILN